MRLIMNVSKINIVLLMLILEDKLLVYFYFCINKIKSFLKMFITTKYQLHQATTQQIDLCVFKYFQIKTNIYVSIVVRIDSFFERYGRFVTS